MKAGHAVLPIGFVSGAGEVLQERRDDLSCRRSVLCDRGTLLVRRLDRSSATVGPVLCVPRGRPAAQRDSGRWGVIPGAREPGIAG
jgi:hypothetical protein